MKKSHNNIVSIALVLIAACGISACSTLDRVTGVLTDTSANIDYHNNQSVKLLSIPPDLTAPQYDRAFALPTGTVSAVSLKNNKGFYNSSDQTNNAGIRKDSATVKKNGSKAFLQVNSSYPRALALTEIMMKRLKFNTVSKTAAGDVITAKYDGEDVPLKDEKDLSFINKLLGTVTIGADKKKTHFNKSLLKGEVYKVSIKNENGLPIVRVQRANGKRLSDAAHTKIISLLNTEFNR